jgi:phosphoribosylaminoimidazolecarboxamide formyltransferase/IMP cyclohydrolase
MTTLSQQEAPAQAQAEDKPRRKRALISVTDKTGLEKFKRLVDAGWEIVSTGGTAKKLREHGIPVTDVSEVTGFPEMMDGRVKTLHPKIFGGILADRSITAHMDALAEHAIKEIDLVVVNLYDFRGKPGIEEIDIGGPSLLRAAAKNFESVTVIINPDDYDRVIQELCNEEKISLTNQAIRAARVFHHTGIYDLAIYNWLIGEINQGRQNWIT